MKQPPQYCNLSLNKHQCKYVTIKHTYMHGYICTCTIKMRRKMKRKHWLTSWDLVEAYWRNEDDTTCSLKKTFGSNGAPISGTILLHVVHAPHLLLLPMALSLCTLLAPFSRAFFPLLMQWKTRPITQHNTTQHNVFSLTLLLNQLPFVVPVKILLLTH